MAPLVPLFLSPARAQGAEDGQRGEWGVDPDLEPQRREDYPFVSEWCLERQKECKEVLTGAAEIRRFLPGVVFFPLA